jgi:hypothetical protein
VLLHVVLFTLQMQTQELDSVLHGLDVRV